MVHREKLVPGVLSRDWLVFHGEWNERWDLSWKDDQTYTVNDREFTISGLKAGMYVIIGD